MAKKLITPKGFRDFLPEDMTVRSEIVNRLREVFEKYGFSELKTPAIEYEEVLLGKYGEDAEKLMYLFEDPGKRKVGLKYDLTVPLARVIASYPDLPKPFRRYQIQPVWRAENTQKGRYREFYQCDVDIVGSSSPIADAEILAVTNDSLSILGFTDYKIKVNSRAVLFSSMQEAGIPEEKMLSAINSIDKLDKKEKDEVEEELNKKGFSAKQIKDMFTAVKKAKPDAFLEQAMYFAARLGVRDTMIFDPTLARGLDYYTGPIFESVIEEPKIGSVTGGGRYDKLLKNLGGPDLPATGTTIGLDRVYEAIKDLNLWGNVPKTSTHVLVTIFSEKTVEDSLKLAFTLREKGINTEVYPDPKDKLDKQLKYADRKNIPWVVILGEKEIKNNFYTLKNMDEEKQEEVKLDELVKKVR